jgi:dihydrofolate reductase
VRKVIVFNQVSLDDFFTDAKGDMSWAHKDDPEWLDFVNNNAKKSGEAIFGRKTYDLMANWWPTPMAIQQAPVVAKAMNDMPKAVFSKKMKKADWSNTRVVNAGLAEEVRKMKKGKAGHRDHGKRQHRVAACCGRPDRRISDCGESHSARQGQDAVRRLEGETRTEADRIAYV